MTRAKEIKYNLAASAREVSGDKKSMGGREKNAFRLSSVDRIEKEWSEAGIGNAFIFGKVMTSRPDLLLELLQYSLPEMNIKSIRDIEREVDLKVSIDAHGVRLDVSASDDQGRNIDVEMQLSDEKNVPKRMRYYAGTIDQTILGTGINYSELTETVILFITPFDPFARDLTRYTFRHFCLEDKELELGDETTMVVLNAMGTKGTVSKELQSFLNLVSGVMTYAEGSFAERVQEQVVFARQNAKWRREYMDWKMTLLNERTKGREEGREEGILLEQIRTVERKLEKGLDLSEIAESMEMNEEEIRPVWEAVKASPPGSSMEQILRMLLTETEQPD